MGYLIRLELEDGSLIEEVADSKACLPHLLPKANDFTSTMLRFVDPYGNTIFNTLQMRLVVEEIDRIAKTVETEPERDILKHIRRLAVKGAKGVHHYLKFYGD